MPNQSVEIDVGIAGAIPRVSPPRYAPYVECPNILVFALTTAY